MNGMTEDIFFAANNFLNSAISDRYNNAQKGKDIKQEEKDDYIIYYAAYDIVNSGGIIDTDDEELKQLFNKVYNVSLEIVKNYDEVSEKKKLVINESKFDDNTHNYLLARKQLIITYRKAFLATHEAFKKMFKHPEM